MTAPKQGRDPYARARECEARIPRLLEIARRHAEMEAAHESLSAEIRVIASNISAALSSGAYDDIEVSCDELAEIAKRIKGENVQAD